MKLRNKKTGEIGNLVLNINQNRESYAVLSTENGDTICGNLVLADYDTLAGLNEEWEDYEEPKVIYYISWDGLVLGSADKTGLQDAKEIGNYFSSREEAEKAVEKLKAWKRLKDKGISLHLQKQFRGDGIGYSRTIYTDFAKDSQEIVKDLDLLFGGEE